MKEAMVVCSVAHGTAVFSTGVLLESRPKPMNARCTAGRALWQKKYIFFTRREVSISSRFVRTELCKICREMRKVA